MWGQDLRSYLQAYTATYLKGCLHIWEQDVYSTQVKAQLTVKLAQMWEKVSSVYNIFSTQCSSWVYKANDESKHTTHSLHDFYGVQSSYSRSNCIRYFSDYLIFSAIWLCCFFCLQHVKSRMVGYRRWWKNGISAKPLTYEDIKNSWYKLSILWAMLRVKKISAS